jgi:hypothetical protein
MHLALWALAGISLLGAGVSLLRPSHKTVSADRGFAREPIEDAA